MPPAQTITAPERALRIRKNPEVRSQEILLAACELFKSEGSNAFILRRIANLAGVRLSTLQYYFPTREVLLTGTLQRLLDDLMAPIHAIAADSALSPERKLRALSDVSISYFSEKSTADFLSDIFALANREPFVKDIQMRCYYSFEHSFAQVLREISSECPDEKIADIAAFITSQLQGLMLFVRRDLLVLNAAAVVDKQVEHLLDISLRMVNEAEHHAK